MDGNGYALAPRWRAHTSEIHMERINGYDDPFSPLEALQATNGHHFQIEQRG
jgi:hypothetical protein